jgi:hypothetical protein
VSVIVAEQDAKVTRAMQDALDPNRGDFDTEEDQVRTVHRHAQALGEVFSTRQGFRRVSDLLGVVSKFRDEREGPSGTISRDPVADLA